MKNLFSRWWIVATSTLIIFGLLIIIISTNQTSPNKTTQTSSTATIPAFVQKAEATPVTTTAPSPTQNPQPTPPPGIGDEYLALGDSVAYGVGAPFPEQLGYAGVFYENYLKLVQPNLISYKNFAVPGETSTSFITPTKNRSQLERALDELDTAGKAGRRISPITLTIGGNDMLEARGKTTAEKAAALERYDANLQKILEQLVAHTGGKSDLIVTTYYNPYAFNTGGEDEETVWVRRFNEVIKKRAAQYQVRVADFFAPVFGQEENLTWIGSGDIHPNTPGYVVLAAAIWQATGYDTQPPQITLEYSALPQDHRLTVGQRLAFKVNVRGEYPSFNLTPTPGSISKATVTLDGGKQIALAGVPPRYNSDPLGSQQFSYVLDTGGLVQGKHVLHFEAVDSAGNIGSLELSFELV
jgi:lysophospholipase L1-like esterase